MANLIKVTMHTARPGLIIGRGGRGIDDLRTELERITPRKVQLNVMEIKQPELDAQLVAESIASQIERRVSFKRAIRLGIARTMQRGGKGIKVIVGGRLGGAEIARSYSDKDGKIPLHTLRADIDYGFSEARTQYGNIGVKVWIYRGEILPGEGKQPPVARPAAARAAAPVAAPAPAGAAPAAAPEKKKGWRRVPKEEATAIAAAAESVDSPEEVAGKDAEGTAPLTEPVETLEETLVATSEAETPTTAEADTPTSSEADTPTSSEAETPTTAEADTPTSSEADTPTTAEADTPTSSEAETPTFSEADTPTTAEAVTPSPEVGSDAPDLDTVVLTEEEGDTGPENAE